ncbi:MAG: pyrroloquinoline quinone biosynthesis protein PqqB [Terrimonas sp.]|nr:pyrroloquinoline quinone biosynthesis protein PqqB [Terrimonas sp.]
MWKVFIQCLSIFILCTGCRGKRTALPDDHPYIIILGIAQDAGYPQAGCEKECCKAYWSGKETRKQVASLGLVIPSSHQLYLFDATPDFTRQWETLQTASLTRKSQPDGLFLTHAHIGHYTGLMMLGREAMSAKGVPVYAMPGMKTFLENNGPWDLLVQLQNIQITTLENQQPIALAGKITVTPIRVPHRDEYSETVGYRICSSSGAILYIPDIDKWQLWDQDIIQMIRENDQLIVDGTFLQNGEIERDMREVPHPFVRESIALFDSLTPQEKNKVIFIHFNHTNPLIRDGKESMDIEQKGYRLAREGMKIPL